MSNDDRHTRREFFRGAARAASLTALAVGAVVLAIRGKRGASSKSPRPSACVGGGMCRSCGNLSACDLPQGIITRDAAGKEQR